MTLQRIALLSAFSKSTPFDAGAADYIARVEAADAAAGQGGGLEQAVKNAIHAFFIGCKADASPNAGVSNFQALKFAVPLFGARTRQGARVPLLSSMATPTEFGTAGGWVYDRKLGLRGNGTDNYLDTGYAYPPSLVENCHISAYYTLAGSSGQDIAARAPLPFAPISFLALISSRLYQDSQSTFSPSDTTTLGFRGISRSATSTYIYRRASANETAAATAYGGTLPNFAIFARFTTGGSIDAYSNRRLSFVTLGEAVDLAALDARVTTLANAIAAALP